MELAIAKGIVQTADDIGNGELSLHENYSGRGMYGRQTAGVVGDFNTFLAALVQFTIETARDEERADFKGEDDPAEDAVTGESIADAMQSLKTDSIGRSDSIFY